MYILITNDVNTVDKEGERRLRKVAKACLNYGHRVQSSVFECEISKSQLCILKDILKGIIESTTDSIRIYYLSRSEYRRVDVLGVETGLKFHDAIII